MIIQTSARFSCKSTKLMKQKLLRHEILPFLKIQLVLRHQERHESGTGWAGALDTAAAPTPSIRRRAHRTRPPGSPVPNGAATPGTRGWSRGEWCRRGDPAAEAAAGRRSAEARPRPAGRYAPSPASEWRVRLPGLRDRGPARTAPLPGRSRGGRGPTSSPA